MPNWDISCSYAKSVLFVVVLCRLQRRMCIHRYCSEIFKTFKELVHENGQQLYMAVI